MKDPKRVLRNKKFAKQSKGGNINRFEVKPITTPKTLAADDSSISYLKATGGQLNQHYSLHDYAPPDDQFTHYFITTDTYPFEVKGDFHRTGVISFTMSAYVPVKKERIPRDTVGRAWVDFVDASAPIRRQELKIPVVEKVHSSYELLSADVPIRRIETSVRRTEAFASVYAVLFDFKHSSPLGWEKAHRDESFKLSAVSFKLEVTS